MKYELISETKKQILGITLYRIRALSNFSDVSAGDLGVFIEKESNLSQTGDAWVYGDALVYGKAQVYDNAQVYGNALVYGAAWVYGTAQVKTTKREKKHVE